MTVRTSRRPTISLVHDTAPERALREVLLDLFAHYALDKWCYAQHLQIEDRPNSYSHPVLTLSARMRAPDEVLAAYLHEQIHWFLILDGVFERSKPAMAHFQTVYPNLPTAPPEGSGSAFGNYLHILVLFLEQASLRDLLGNDHAYQLFRTLPSYTALLALVLRDYAEIEHVMQRHDLLLPTLPPATPRFVDITPSGSQAGQLPRKPSS